MAIYVFPRNSLIYMDNKIIKVEVNEDLKKKINYNNIKNAKGIIKNIITPIEYQKKIRAEWD